MCVCVCVCTQVLLRKLSLELMRKLDDELKHSTATAAAFYEHRLQVGPGGGREGEAGWVATPMACVVAVALVVRWWGVRKRVCLGVDAGVAHACLPACVRACVRGVAWPRKDLADVRFLP